MDVPNDEDRQLKEAYLALRRGGRPVAICNLEQGILHFVCSKDTLREEPGGFAKTKA